MEAICKEYKYSSAEVCLHEDATADQLIDVIEGNRVYIPCLYVVNKIDAITMEELEILDKIPNYVPISAYKGWNIEELLEKMWTYLNLKRIYTKPRGQVCDKKSVALFCKQESLVKVPDYSAPIVIRSTHCTVADLASRIHKDIIRQMKHALVWGSSVRCEEEEGKVFCWFITFEIRHQPQRVGKDHVLEDEDVVGKRKEKFRKSQCLIRLFEAIIKK